MSTQETPFQITKEEVLNLAAQRLVDAFSDESDLSEVATRLIREKVTEHFSKQIVQRIDAFLTEEMQKLIGQEILPVNIWGEREGLPTTIRATLAERARKFWEVNVSEDGRECGYGGAPRSKQLMQQLLKDEFSKAVKENADVIVAEFKSSLKVDAIKLVTEHIDKLIVVKGR